MKILQHEIPAGYHILNTSYWKGHRLSIGYAYTERRNLLKYNRLGIKAKDKWLIYNPKNSLYAYIIEKD